MKYKCKKACPYECIVELKITPKYSSKDAFATCCIYDAGNVEWVILEA